jgi:hypothetical protein
MNIYEFVNSRNIAEYWQKIGFVPNALESAWLVYQSKNLTIEEKHEAWLWIISNMPDCQIPSSSHHPGKPSLKGYLRELIAKQKEARKDFFKSSATTYYNGGLYTTSSSCWDPTAFATFEACIEHLDDYESDPKKILRYEITKFKLIDQRYTEEYQAVFGCDMNMRDMESMYCDNLLSKLYFCFPVPFEKGDILARTKNETATISEKLSCMENVVYLSHGCDNDPKQATYEDMKLKGYFGHFDGVRLGSELCYLDFEFVKGRLDGTNRFLSITSELLKGKLDISDYAEMYHLIKVDMIRDHKSELYDRLNSL